MFATAYDVAIVEIYVITTKMISINHALVYSSRFYCMLFAMHCISLSLKIPVENECEVMCCIEYKC